MANGDGSKTAKVVVGIILGVLVLSVLCCAGAYFLIPQDARSLFGEGVTMARQMAAGVQNYDNGFAADFGEDSRWQMGGGGQEALLLLGVPADQELDEATVADLQDRAWERYAMAFAEGGPPLSGVAIGRAGARTSGPGSYQGHVTEWTKHVVDVDTLVERTGIPAPPEMEFFESIQELESEAVRVETEGDEIRVEVDATGEEDEAVPVPEVEQE